MHARIAHVHVAHAHVHAQVVRTVRLGVVVCLLALVGVGCTEQPRTGIVLKVFDGDTVKLASGEVIRLLGIDTPERNSRNKTLPQPFHREARDALVALVDKKTVRVTDSKRLTDRYNRTLAYLHLPDGTDVQREMLRGGYAMLTVYPPDLGHLESYASAQAEAREQRIGMWADPYFSVLPIENGIPNKDGPVRISGIITGLSLTGRRVEIIVSEILTLYIIHSTWQNFWADAKPQQWIGKSVIAQGRIKSKSKTMHITHPVMLMIDGVSAQ